MKVLWLLKRAERMVMLILSGAHCILLWIEEEAVSIFLLALPLCRNCIRRFGGGQERATGARANVA